MSDATVLNTFAAKLPPIWIISLKSVDGYRVARNFAGVYFCGLAIFCVFRELIFAIKTDWFFLPGINFCDFHWKNPVPTCNRNTYFQIHICYSPAERSVLGETVLRPRAQFLPIRTDLSRWITFLFFFLLRLKSFRKILLHPKTLCVLK